MFEVDSTLFKKKILETFKYTQKLLERHNLKYIACGGTVLGAIRHQGFIPWDDDIDIYMPREDYNKLIQLNIESEKEGFQIISAEYTPGYYLPFAKIVDVNSSIWEHKEIPFMIGVYVDIFPLDEFPYSNIEITNIQNRATKLFNSYMFTLSHYNLKYLISSIMNLDLKRLGGWCKSRFLKSTMQYKKYFSYIKKYTDLHGDKCVCINTWQGKIFKTEWFTNVIEVPFEDTTIIIPRDYDSYLTLLYGNYMTPPPIEKRISGHNHYFIDLTRRYTLEEIRKKGINC